jgi:hypothetical protein
VPTHTQCYTFGMAEAGVVRSLDSVLEEVGRFFVGRDPVHEAARAIARLLDDAGIAYAVADALCLGAHGVVRATEDVDILLAREDLDRFKAAWLGRGYVNLRAGGKAVRDTARGVKIDFLLTGDFPGDGREKPIAFPSPGESTVDAEGIRVLALPTLIELKLASGMTAPHRLQDLADVLRLIEVRQLSRDFESELHPWVRAKFEELWTSAQHPPDDY